MVRISRMEQVQNENRGSLKFLPINKRLIKYARSSRTWLESSNDQGDLATEKIKWVETREWSKLKKETLIPRRKSVVL